MADVNILLDDSIIVEVERVGMLPPSSLTHNGLSGVQGGTVNERYHLTAAQVESLDNPPAPGVTAHNDLDDIQGGTADERYHLTAAQVDLLENPPPPDVPTHNGLGGIQGGTINERYHLTAAQVSSLDNMPTVGGFISLSSEVAIASAIALTAAAFGLNHKCSGVTTDYTVILPAPAGNAGKVIGFRMDSALTKRITIDAGAGVAIDGSRYKVMWAKETVWLYCDGANWVVMSEKRNRCYVLITPPQGGAPYTFQTVANGTYTKIDLSVATSDAMALFDAPNKRIMVPRDGDYIIQAGLDFNSTVSSGKRYIVTPYRNGSSSGMLSAELTSSTTAETKPQISQALALSKGDYIEVYAYHDAGVGQGIYQWTGASYISLKEI